MNGLAKVLILLWSVVALSATAYAGEETEKMQEIQEVLASKRATHARLAEKSATLNAEVAQLRKNIMQVSRNLQNSEENLTMTEKRLKDLREKKVTYMENLTKDQQAMDDLVSAARRYSQTSTSLMLAETKPIDAARASIIMKSIMPLIHQQSAFLQTRLAEIADIERDIEDQLQLQTQQNKKLNRQNNELARLLDERNDLYLSTENQRLAQEKEVAILTKESKSLEDLIERLKGKHKEKEKLAKKGLPANILLPVHGTIKTAFGDKDELGAASKGLTFATRPGASVITPLAGTVKFAGAFQNYKQILIVEHAGGYHSLITGLARIDTVVGAALSAGEPVGRAETSGSPQVYYELRQNGKPVNPQKLLVAQRKQEKI